MTVNNMTDEEVMAAIADPMTNAVERVALQITLKARKTPGGLSLSARKTYAITITSKYAHELERFKRIAPRHDCEASPITEHVAIARTEEQIRARLAIAKANEYEDETERGAEKALSWVLGEHEGPGWR